MYFLTFSIVGKLRSRQQKEYKRMAWQKLGQRDAVRTAKLTNCCFGSVRTTRNTIFTPSPSHCVKLCRLHRNGMARLVCLALVSPQPHAYCFQFLHTEDVYVKNITCRDMVFAMSFAVTESASISSKNVSHAWNSVDGQVGLRTKNEHILIEKIQNWILFAY